MPCGALIRKVGLGRIRSSALSNGRVSRPVPRASPFSFSLCDDAHHDACQTTFGHEEHEPSIENFASDDLPSIRIHELKFMKLSDIGSVNLQQCREAAYCEPNKISDMIDR